MDIWVQSHQQGSQGSEVPASKGMEATALSRSEPSSEGYTVKDGDRESCTIAAVRVLSVAPYLTQVPRTRPCD